MHAQLQALNIFLASPGDLVEERKIARLVVEELNSSIGRPLGWRIELYGWEDSPIGIVRPQTQINEEVNQCDLFVGMLWERWGHPPGESDYRSGFEEELELAKARWTRDGLPEIWLFLKDIDSIRPTTLCSFSATIVRMASSAISVRFDEHTMWIELTDGRTLGLPLAWFPRLLRATPAEREQVTLSHAGLHWEAIDEDISIAGLLAGRGDMTRSTGHAV